MSIIMNQATYESGGGGDYVEPYGIYWIVIEDKTNSTSITEIRGYDDGVLPAASEYIKETDKTGQWRRHNIYAKATWTNTHGGLDITMIGEAYATAFVPSYATGNQPYVITVNQNGTITNPYGPY